MKFGRPYGQYICPVYKRRFNRWAVIILVITALVYCIVTTMKNSYPVIADVSQKYLQTYGTRIINDSVLDSLGNNIYNEIMDISYDANGQITSINTNTTAINRLKSSLTLDILNDIELLGSEGFTIPLGNFTDIIFLSGVGPDIPFKIIPYGSVQVDLRSEFSEAGINQTRHQVYIDITADLNAVSVISRIRGKVSTSVLASQTVIVGQIPKFYAK